MLILFLQLLMVDASWQSSDAERIIQIPALSKDGYVGTLGGLYSIVDNAVIPGLSIYKGSRIPETDLTMSSLGETTCRSEVVHDEVEKNMAAGMSADIELSVYSGSVSLTGSSRVFKEFTVSHENINAVLTYEHRSFQEVIDMDNADTSVLSSAKAKRYYATHVITGVQWGLTLHTTFSFKIGNGMNRSKFESDVNAELGFLSSRLEARANKDVENVTILRTSQYKMSFYSDIMLPKSVPTSLTEMIDIVNSVPDAIKTSYSGKGRIRSYILTPIRDIIDDDDRCNPDQNYTTSEFAQAEDFSLRFHARSTFILNSEIRKLYSDVVKDYENFDYMVHTGSVTSLSSLYLNYSTVYTNIYLPQIRSIIRNSKISRTANISVQIHTVASWYKQHPFGAEKIVEDLRYLWNIMKYKISYNSIINKNGVKFLKQDGSISQVLLKNDQSEVFILLLPHDANVTHTAGDTKGAIRRSTQTDPYGHWRFKLHSLFLLTGTKYVADCRFEDIPECQNLHVAVIRHYKRGFLVNRNLINKAFEEWNDEEIDGDLMTQVESFDEQIPHNVLGK